MMDTQVQKKQALFFRCACVLGAFSVAAGAFGAHAMKDRLAEQPALKNAFEVGVRYMMYHALAMLAVSLCLHTFSRPKFAIRACGAWLVGILLFSGSLLAMAVTENRSLVIITPFGGLFLIFSWINLLFARPGNGKNNQI